MRTYAPSTRREQGFTLIELLVAIAIIAILAAILIPSFAEAQKKPYDTAALQCGRAIFTAIPTWRGDHGGAVFPDQGKVADLGADVNEVCAQQGVQVKWFDSTGLTKNAAGNGMVSNYNGGNCFLTWHPSGSSLYEFHGCGDGRSIRAIKW